MNNIPVSGLIGPIFTTDNYPVIDPMYGIDGLRNVFSVSDRNNIPLERRRAGMLVGVVSTASGTTDYYKLKPEGNTVTWSLGDSSNWEQLITGLSVSVVPTKYFISNEILYVPPNYEYFIYGDLTIGSGGTFSNSGKVVLLNGTLSFIGDGTYSGSGTFSILNIPDPNNDVNDVFKKKYSASFSAGIGDVLTITHSLNTSDIVFTVRDGYNFIYPNIELDNTNPDTTIKLTTTGTISNGRINIIG
jgi:hypothetical protein